MHVLQLPPVLILNKDISDSAHAGAQPWAGVNALDAAVIAYTSISALRQQVKPDHRLHGTLEGRNWAANIIPDYAKMTWIARAPTWAEVEILRERVENCLKCAQLQRSRSDGMADEVGRRRWQRGASIRSSWRDHILTCA
jgi:acetylornithine deacetylase/succinyl-diaminopimelate desuccinylase-like protein